MKSSLEKTGSLGRKLSVEVPTDMVNSAFERVYKGIQKNANIKGFRKGKAPLNMIKSMYNDRVKQDVLQDLIGMAYEHALGEHKLMPISQPNVHFDLIEAEQPFKFTAEFEIRPEVTLKKISGLKVEKEQIDLSKEKVESVLTQIRESRAQIVPVFEDRTAQMKDIAEIDFVGTVDGKPLDGGTMNGYKLELGSNQFIPGFEDGVVGMKVGAQKTLSLKFPDDYGHKDIAGKAVQFVVTLKGLHKKDLPALTDEWVASIGAGQKTVEDLKKAIEEDISQQESKRIADELKNRLLRTLVDENPVEVPAGLKEQQKNLLISDVEKRMKSQGMTDADLIEYQSKWSKDFDDTASFMVQSSFLIDAIAKKEGLEATEKDVQERLDKYAKQTGIEMAKLKDFYLNNHQRLGQMEYQITEEKVVQFLLDKADVKEVPRSKLSQDK